MSKRIDIDTAEFIRRAREVHGDEYDYSKTVYTKMGAKIIFTCPIHGDQEVYAQNHLKGCKCPRCVGKGKKTREDFIEDAKKVHGDKYDYSEVEYRDAKTKVKIICHEIDPNTGLEHGGFWVTPSNHLKTRGCPKCKHQKAHDRYSSNKDEFIKRAREVHGDKYDYSLVEYYNAMTKVKIICHEIDHLTGEEHGVFEQRPADHLKGDGCPNCAPNKKHTTESFVRKLKELYGDAYDYNSVNYVNYNTEITLICKEHGPFTRLPSVLMRGVGCPICRQDGPPYSYEEFVNMTRKVHGDEFDYSKAIFVSKNKPVTIICKKGHEFQMTPTYHLAGHGCPHCLEECKMSTDKFIEKAKEVHGDKYDYSKVEYTRSKDNVTIICHEKDPITGEEHGEFQQTAHNHLVGGNCPKCTGHHMNQELFIARSSIIHNGKYDYSKVKYVNNSTPVIIICPIHGEFSQRPDMHLEGKGCKICGGHAKSNTFEFIEKAKAVHGDKYDYSLVDYKNSKTDVKIICKKHGQFGQSPSDHLSGSGCPYCNSSKLESLTKYILDHDYPDVRYEKGKHFKWLRNKGEMHLDFYLPDYNIGIECQGIQHFQEDRRPHKADRNSLENNKYRDRLKKKLCDEHGIKIYYFSQLGIDYPYFVYEDFHDLMDDVIANSQPK